MEPYVYQIIVWAVIVVASVVIEISTINLTTVWFAIAGVVSLILAVFKVELVWQIVAFLVLSIVLLLLTRPLINKITRKNSAHTNADRIFDRVGFVTKEITADEIGEVKVDEDIWRAISYDNEPLEVGQKVVIKSFDGNKVIVSKAN